jgi:lipoprotein-anchoring transpeptidase ErfK/SrfK
MLKKILGLSVAIAAFAGVHEASAGQRYRVVAPVVVGQNLTSPWVNQLGGKIPVVYPDSGRRVQVRHPLFEKVPVAPQPQAAPSATQTQPVAYQRSVSPVRAQINPKFLPQTVAYETKQKPGSVVIDTENRFLYYIEGNGRARRYGVGVGKPGFEWAGIHKVTRKAEWPGWTPPKEMISREAKKGHYLPAHMEGGPANPLGARAMYIGSTEYRIHGTNAPWSIGYAVSSGCIRLRNEDVVDLYERVKVGATVLVK